MENALTLKKMYSAIIELGFDPDQTGVEIISYREGLIYEGCWLSSNTEKYYEEPAEGINLVSVGRRLYITAVYP